MVSTGTSRRWLALLRSRAHCRVPHTQVTRGRTLQWPQRLHRTVFGPLLTRLFRCGHDSPFRWSGSDCNLTCGPGVWRVLGGRETGSRESRGGLLLALPRLGLMAVNLVMLDEEGAVFSGSPRARLPGCPSGSLRSREGWWFGAKGQLRSSLALRLGRARAWCHMPVVLEG